MKAGADDYVLKEKIRRLPFVVREALQKEQARKEKEQAENELRQSEEKYRVLFEHTSEALFVAQDGRIVFHNPRTAAFSGYSSEELLSRPFIEFIHKDDREMVLDNQIRRLRGEEVPERYVVRIIHRDGGILWGVISSVVIQWNGKPATLNFLSDITERKQAEEALKESESSLKSVLESTTDGILAIGKDRSVLYTNDRFAEMWRIPKDILKSKDDLVLLQYVLDQLADPDGFINKVEELYHSDEESFDTFEFKDGKVFERLSHPLLKDTEIFGRVWSFRDITKRKRAEETQREQKALLSAIYRNAPLVLMVVDSERRIQQVNGFAVQFAGQDAEEMLGLRSGEALRCLHALDDPQGCGFGE